MTGLVAYRFDWAPIAATGSWRGPTDIGEAMDRIAGSGGQRPITGLRVAAALATAVADDLGGFG
ncbi:MAG: hypothetical protein P4L82_15805 [Ancalomicrobiaceae bacterium]|nr:hypothetical protein [Ancalomicrobiaceae bacterium]